MQFVRFKDLMYTEREQRLPVPNSCGQAEVVLLSSRAMCKRKKLH